MEAKLSICIPVFNQIDLLKWNLDTITKYGNDDVQIVVSDNCSTDPIKELVESFGDSRIKYCRTNSNHGHDGNIINALKNCDAKFAFLLRTRDTILVDKIPTIIKTIEENPNFAYMRFSALGDEGVIRMAFKNESYECGEGTVKADFCIPIHPSGELYNLSFLQTQDLDNIAEFLKERFPQNNGFLTHILLRHFLVSKSTFMTNSAFAWYYAYTYKAKDMAVVNNGDEKRGYSPYSPRYQYPRYEAEIEYVLNNLPKEYQPLVMRKIVKRYAEYITTIFKVFNDSQGLRDHYKAQKEDFSTKEEKKKFIAYTKNNFNFCDKETKKQINRLAVFYIRIFLPLKMLKRKIMQQEYQI